MVNIIYGLLGGFLFRRVKKTASLLELLCYSVYLPSLGLIFFSNMIFFFPILFEIIVVVLFAHLVTAKVAHDITGRVKP